jgi:[acyl-carrier-protein] S-malonyltransferase
VSGSIVAHVAGRPITLAEVEDREAELARGPRRRHLPPGNGPARAYARRWLVRELVAEAVIRHDAAGIDGHDVGALVERVTGAAAVSEDEARGYYVRNLDLFRRPERRHIRHVVVADEATARALAEAGPAGLERADDLTIVRGELAGALEEALFGASVGAVVGPIRTEHGWHVARVDGAQLATVAAFEDVRADIEAELLAAARRRAFEDWLEHRRSELAVIEPEFAHPGDPAGGLPTHRH